MLAIPQLNSLQGIRRVFCVSGIFSLEDNAHSSVCVQIGSNRSRVSYGPVSPQEVFLFESIFFMSRYISG